MEGCELKFTDDALNAIARKALDKGTGARGLRSIIEQVMLDIMYDLPSQPKGSKIVITDDIVNGNRKRYEVPDSKSA